MTQQKISEEPLVHIGSIKSFDTLKEQASRCHRCSLRGQEQVSKVVFGSGDPKADLMFIGEAPGKNEDKDGIPFTGLAGQMLNRIITNGLKLSRDKVYIANVLKCRPPGNRDPENIEIHKCTPWLDKQIELIDPKFIVTLGKFASCHILRREPKNTTMSYLRTQQVKLGNSLVIPTWHPAFLLRRQDKALNDQLWNDLMPVRKHFGVA
jgi:DNA polymerase